MDYNTLFLKSLVLTVLIETVTLILLIKFLKLKEIGIVQLVTAGVVSSFATLPYLWFVLPCYIHDTFWHAVVGECSVVLIESFIIMSILRLKYYKSLVFSFVCNSISFLIGVLLF